MKRNYDVYQISFFYNDEKSYFIIINVCNVWKSQHRNLDVDDDNM
jgi:hypothetical protein